MMEHKSTINQAKKLMALDMGNNMFDKGFHREEVLQPLFESAGAYPRFQPYME
jgi:hypothetical protein